MNNPIKYEFTSCHKRMDRYNITRGIMEVYRSSEGGYSASHAAFGCSKEYATPEAAIRNMLADHSCTVTIHGKVGS